MLYQAIFTIPILGYGISQPKSSFFGYLTSATRLFSIKGSSFAICKDKMIAFRLIRKIIFRSSSMQKDIDFEEFAYSAQQSNTQKNTIRKTSTEEAETLKYGKIRKIPEVVTKKKIGDHEQVLNKIIEWRRQHLAPVDTMGCQRLADPKASLETQKFQTLISLMLSIQTKDETTSMCVNRLKQYGLTPQSMASISQEKLIELIYECNFNKRKAKNIIEVSNIVLKRGIARTKEDLLEYPGVGVKIAMIYMNVAQGQQEGIGVDTHVHRICNRLGWVKTEDPNATEKQLQLAFSKQYWKEMNIALVGFGQLICNAKKPLCSQCPVSHFCPSSTVKW